MEETLTIERLSLTVCGSFERRWPAAAWMIPVLGDTNQNQVVSLLVQCVTRGQSTYGRVRHCVPSE
jgi:hypothetical protein